MAVASPFAYTVGSTVYDLMKVVRWTEPSPQTVPETVNVSFIDTPNTTIQFEKAPFEAAMQAAFDAL